MWQAIRSIMNLCVRIKETQLSHGWPNVLKQEVAQKTQKTQKTSSWLSKEGGVSVPPLFEAAD
jgi:hypothetical protein